MTANITPFTPNTGPPARPEQAAALSERLRPFGQVLRAILPSATAQNSLADLAAAPEPLIGGPEMNSAAETGAGDDAGSDRELPVARQLRAFSDIRLGAEATRTAPSGMTGEAGVAPQPAAGGDPFSATPSAFLDADGTRTELPEMPDAGLTVRGIRGISATFTTPGSGDAVTGHLTAPPLKAGIVTPGGMQLISSVHGRNMSGHSPGAGASAAARYPAPAPLNRYEASTSSAVQVTVLPAGSGWDVRLRLGALPADGPSRLREEISAILASHGLRIGTIAVFAPTFPQSLKEET